MTAQPPRDWAKDRRLVAEWLEAEHDPRFRTVWTGWSAALAELARLQSLIDAWAKASAAYEASSGVDDSILARAETDLLAAATPPEEA